MGSVKKKSLASMEKTQQQSADEEAGKQQQQKKKGGKEGKPLGERKRPEVIAPRANEQELVKSLSSLKAITIYGASRNLSVNASIAKSILGSLESKGLITKVGGFSGHYVWAVAS